MPIQREAFLRIGNEQSVPSSAFRMTRSVEQRPAGSTMSSASCRDNMGIMSRTALILVELGQEPIEAIGLCAWASPRHEGQMRVHTAAITAAKVAGSARIAASVNSKLRFA
jgi:hypothetical protein